MCGPRQLIFFQCGSETPKVRTPCKMKSELETETFHQRDELDETKDAHVGSKIVVNSEWLQLGLGLLS